MQFIKVSFIIILMMGINSKSFAQELTIFPGFGSFQYYQDDQKISKLEFETLLSENADANSDWIKSKKDMRAGLLFLGAEIGFLYWGINSIDKTDSNVVPIISLVGVLGSATASIIFASSANKLKKNAILKYNNGLESNTSIDISLQRNGLGLSLTF